MSGKKDKVPSGAIQRIDNNPLLGTINTPNGPAMIQVIDIGGGAMGPSFGGAAGAAKPSGINILGAVLRRWWLVLLPPLVVGGGETPPANRLVSPTYEANA